MLMEHQFSNVERYHGKNSIFVDAGQKCYTKVHNIISSFLFWATQKLVATNRVNILVFDSCYTREHLHHSESFVLL